MGAALPTRSGSAVTRGRGEFVGQRHGALADHAAGQRNLQRSARRFAGSTCAREHRAGHLDARDDAEGAFRLLRLRFQCVGGLVGAHGVQPFGRLFIGGCDEFMDLVQYGEIRENWANLYKQAMGSMNNPEGSLVGKQPPANPAPARPLSDYAGVYANDYWGPAVVTERDGALQLSMGPKNRTFTLTHWD